ncbi:MAG TPA: hypothetical protein VGN72_01675 [Tepidisphaeraceae bacterium]|nr:hypothetical protein [Tepidisphaeraceae bacterium]
MLAIVERRGGGLVRTRKYSAGGEMEEEAVTMNVPRQDRKFIERYTPYLIGLFAMILLASLVMMVAGIVLVALDDEGPSELTLFEQSIKTGSVGVACVVGGGVLLVTSFLALLKTINMAIAQHKDPH